MCDVLSESICNKISELIFEMTNKNYGNIKEETLKELQNICKYVMMKLTVYLTLRIIYYGSTIVFKIQNLVLGG